MKKEVQIDPEFEFLYEKGPWKAGYGGRGGKKSWGFAQAIIVLSCMYQMRILCAREVQKSIKDSVYKLLKDMINRMGLASQFYITNNTIQNTYTGSEILFTGLQDHTVDSIKSFERINLCWLEEAHSITQKSLDVLIPTIVRVPNYEIWASWNPDLPTDPIDKLLRGNNIPNGAVVKEFCYLDNQYLTDEFHEEAKRLKEEDYEKYCHIYLGHYRAQGDNQLISYKLIKKATEGAVEFMDVPAIAGIDPAREGDDRMACVIRKGNQILWENTWPFTNDYFPPAREMARECIKHGVSLAVIDYVGVGSGFYDILREVSGGQFDLKKFNGGEKKKASEYYNKRAEMWDKLRKWLENGGKVPNTSEWIEDLAITKYFYTEQTKLRIEKKETIKSNGGKSPDIGDALSMTFDTSTKKKLKKQKVRKWAV